MFSFGGAEGFSCSLKALFGGTRIKLFNFFTNMDVDLDPGGSQKAWIRIRNNEYFHVEHGQHTYHIA